jgi:hypothetical protein
MGGQIAGAILLCGQDGVFQPLSCAANTACRAQPNGTGVCL